MTRRMAMIRFGCGVVLVAGCQAEGDSREDAEVLPSMPAPNEFTRTVVRMGPGGDARVTVSRVTAVEQAIEVQKRLAPGQPPAPAPAANEGLGTAQQAITEDTSCYGSSLWMFDQYGLAGNEICFYRAGVADLSTYHFTTCTPTWVCHLVSWNSRVRSYLPGAEGGCFMGPDPTEIFSPYGAEVDHASNAASHADHVALDDTIGGGGGVGGAPSVQYCMP